MVRKVSLRKTYTKKVFDFWNHVVEEKPLLPFLVPLILFAWLVERWLVSFSNWVPLAVAVWATIERGRYQRKQLVEDLNHRWNQFMLQTSNSTAVEPCEWLNKLLMDVWPNFLEHRISKKLSSTVEKRLKRRKPKGIESIKLLEFSLGSRPPCLGLWGAHWYTSGDKRILQMGFDWVTNDMSIMFSAKLAKPLLGTARIVINELKIKGTLLLMPVLEGQAVLYSFESTPEVGIGVAFGSGGSQSLPATELPGVPTWLVKLLNDTLNKQLVEPHRGCFSLPAEDNRRTVTGGVLSVTVTSGRHLVGRNTSNIVSGSRHYQEGNNYQQTDSSDDLFFVEAEIGDLTRRTGIAHGLHPSWDDTFNMFLHGETGILKLNLYKYTATSIKCEYLTSCEVKMKYVPDGSTIFWAIGNKSGVIAERSERCGEEVELVVPFEGSNSGEIHVSLVLKEWQFSDNSSSTVSSMIVRSQQSTNGSSDSRSRTGRKIKVTVVEGRNLAVKSGKCDPYVKLQYGKVLRKTRTILNNPDPEWRQEFEFDEIGNGEYLKLKCFSSDLFGDENIGSASLIMDGIPEGSPKDVCIPLEKVNTGELRLQLEAIKSDDPENSLQRSDNGIIELAIIEARDIIAADVRGTSDPFVRVHYGNIKKRTKVIYKTLNPRWDQTLDFPDNGSSLQLHLKDYNAVLPARSIGHCVIEYERLPPNQKIDKWIPLEGVRSGEIHIQITRKFHELEKKSSLDASVSSHCKASKISAKVKEQLKKLQMLVDDGDLESLSLFLSEVESAEDVQEEYMLQLEKEKSMLLDKINTLDHEISKISHSAIHKTLSY